jgi:hypothetical protein
MHFLVRVDDSFRIATTFRNSSLIVHPKCGTLVLQLNSADKIVTTIVTYEEQTRGWLAYAAMSRATAHQIKAYSRLRKHLLFMSASRFSTSTPLLRDNLITSEPSNWVSVHRT